MIYDNYTGRQVIVGIARRLYLFGVISGLILSGLIYLVLKVIF